MAPTKRRAAARKKPAPAITREQFTALADFLSGYLHQDFVVEYGTPAAAYQAFLADASPVEIRNLQRDSRMFLATTKAASWPVMRDALLTLTTAWRPASQAALERFLKTIAAGPTRAQD